VADTADELRGRLKWFLLGRVAVISWLGPFVFFVDLLPPRLRHRRKSQHGDDSRRLLAATIDTKRHFMTLSTTPPAWSGGMGAREPLVHRLPNRLLWKATMKKHRRADDSPTTEPAGDGQEV
ncbi:MAG TPA: hypothetical protein VL049_18710, partial [Candidatus Dormibacteraeota bacterium]|nr:hypothetical protein [Candidatus Dormibacteraeota bacterium]